MSPSEEPKHSKEAWDKLNKGKEIHWGSMEPTPTAELLLGVQREAQFLALSILYILTM